jgi:peptide/nickel transport system permease protein
MRRFVVRRAAQALVVVFLVATLTFALIHLAPGDPFAATMENPLISEAVRAQWRAAYGLDRPLPEQYWRYLVSVAHGELGYSFSVHRPVSAALAAALPNTLLLMGLAIAASFTLGTALGVLQAVRRGSLADRALGGTALLFYAMPDFWLALMTMLVFAYWLPVFPVGGVVDPVLHEYMGPLARAADRARHLVLPAATLALLNAAVVARYQRAAMLEVVHRDFVRTARAKGLTERAVVYRHALRNALLPTITLLGLSFPALLGGAVFVERVFSWPGMGLLTVNAIAARDYPLVTASVMLGGAMVALGNLLADLLYAAVDPRLRERE